MPLQIPRMVAFGTKADMPLTPVNVRFRRKRKLAGLNKMSAFDPKRTSG
jgi:hypothetical protein